MFNSKTRKGEETRARVQDAALALFREKGLDATTMRDVAAGAGLSLGAAYHYFPSKEAIVLGYYNTVQARHAEAVLEAVRTESTPRGRIAAAVHWKLDTLAGDRKVLGALLRFTGDPDHPLSFLGAGTRDIQLRSIATFAVPLESVDLPADFRRAAAVTLWALHMGILLYFLYDDSPGQARTHRLADGAIDLFLSAMRLLRFPPLRPLRTRLTRLLDEAGLLPDLAALPRPEPAPPPGA
ncbi:MAG TPA: TetR/AcrR family transcriptional regulator [Longimicrobium sp.]|nr:TetR/AcrR family transcriptional regulator [Longimicrobium sp.]